MLFLLLIPAPIPVSHQPFPSSVSPSHSPFLIVPFSFPRQSTAPINRSNQPFQSTVPIVCFPFSVPHFCNPLLRSSFSVPHSLNPILHTLFPCLIPSIRHSILILRSPFYKPLLYSRFSDPCSCNSLHHYSFTVPRSLNPILHTLFPCLIPLIRHSILILRSPFYKSLLYSRFSDPSSCNSLHHNSFTVPRSLNPILHTLFPCLIPLIHHSMPFFSFSFPLLPTLVFIFS